MKRLERKWMYEERYDKKKCVTNTFVEGVAEFVEFAKQQDEYRLGENKLRCPCSKCKNLAYLQDFEVEEHLYTSGFCPNYYDWICHGESYSLILEQPQSNYERALHSAAKSKGKLPTPFEIFLDTHTKVGDDGERSFMKKKDKAIYDTYISRLDNNSSKKKETELWFEVVEGFKKGSVYGTGSAQDLFYEAPSRRSSAMQKKSYVPGIVSQLQDQLEAQQQREAERDEELRKMREQLEMMQSFFSSCNPGFRPPNPDPRDPFGGGGSGASFGFQV